MAEATDKREAWTISLVWALWRAAYARGREDALNECEHIAVADKVMSEPTGSARCPTCLSTDPKYKAYPVVEQCSHSNELHHCMFATCKDPFHHIVPAPPTAPASPSAEALPWYLDRKSSRYQRSNDAEREIASLRAECERLRRAHEELHRYNSDIGQTVCEFCEALECVNPPAQPTEGK